jgi:hypothetical protein
MKGDLYVDNVRISPGLNEISDRDLVRLLKNDWFAHQMVTGLFEVDESAIGYDDIEQLTVAEAAPVIDAIDDIEQLRTYLNDPRVTIRREAHKRIQELTEQAEKTTKKEGTS